MLQAGESRPPPGKVTFGGATPAHKGDLLLLSSAVMSDESSGQGKNNHVLPPWRVTLGEETLFTEAARVECCQVAMPHSVSRRRVGKELSFLFRAAPRNNFAGVP